MGRNGAGSTPCVQMLERTADEIEAGDGGEVGTEPDLRGNQVKQ